MCIESEAHGRFAHTAGNVAPALQAKRIELEKQQLEDKLEGRLERRPDREDLERRGIVRQRGRSYRHVLQSQLILYPSQLSFTSRYTAQGPVCCSSAPGQDERS